MSGNDWRDDEMRERLRRLDPVPETVAVEAPTSASARARLEEIMSTPTDATTRLVTPAPARWRRPRVALGAAAAAVALAGIGVAMATTGGGGGATAAPLELSLGANDSLASCLALDPAVLAAMSPAFGGTVTAIDGEDVTIDVDTWYAGGDADTVVLRAPGGLEALIGTIEFTVGERYLITAAEGVVNYCGYSGPAGDPALAAAFAEAFGR